MSLTDRAHILAQNALDVISWGKIPMYPTQRDTTQLDENWHIVVIGSLYRANKILRSVTALLNPALEDSVSATILNRNLFECAANIVYLNQGDLYRMLHSIGDYVGCWRSEGEGIRTPESPRGLYPFLRRAHSSTLPPPWKPRWDSNPRRTAFQGRRSTTELRGRPTP